MKLVSESNLLKGELFMAALWLGWHAKGREERNRPIVLATLCAALGAIVLGRLLAHFLPYRVRPLVNPAFVFDAPFPATAADAGRAWSAFPSDHAMLFSALATGLWFISRRAGAAAHVYWLALIGFPRVYLGLHHPTDVLAGGAFGAAMSWAANGERARAAVDEFFRPFRQARPGLFYAALFLLSFQIGTMFDEPRQLLRGLLRARAGAAAPALTSP